MVTTRPEVRVETVRLGPHETRLRRLLEAVHAANTAGHKPTKADLTRDLPPRDRANHYQAVNTLLARRLVANDSGGSSYALVVTDSGRAILDGADAVDITVITMVNLPAPVHEPAAAQIG